MGAKFKGNYKIPNYDDVEIETLENKIKQFCDNNQDKIKNIFNSGFNAEENIRFGFSDNGDINRDEKNDPFAKLKDYVISFSIPGKMNPTKCALTFFNLGSFFGSNGFLYSICLFYSNFFKITINNESNEDIQEKINDCFNAIDNNDKDKLNEIWNTHLEDDELKSLRIGKDFLINTICISEKELKEDLKNSINSNFWNCWKTFKYKSKNLLYGFCIFFATIFSRKNYNNDKNNYINFKNNINKKLIFESIIYNLYNTKFFEDYNLFIIAMDDNQINGENCFSTFMGYYCEGLGTTHRARKLKYEVIDGFDSDIDVYDYYFKILLEIRNFFENK